MIKFTGTIIGSNGVAAYTDGEINLNISMPNKWLGTLVKAELGEKTETVQLYEVQEPIEVDVLDEESNVIGTKPGTNPVTKHSIIKGWNLFDVIDSFATTEIIDPSFEELQDTMLASLKAKYPTVQFEIL